MSERDGAGAEARELREVLRKFAEPAKCQDVDDYDLWTEQVLDQMFREIEAAGFCIVPADRYEALRHDAAEWGRHCQTHGGGPVLAHRPGDLAPLDPVPGQEGQE